MKLLYVEGLTTTIARSQKPYGVFDLDTTLLNTNIGAKNLENFMKTFSCLCVGHPCRMNNTHLTRVAVFGY